MLNRNVKLLSNNGWFWLALVIVLTAATLLRARLLNTFPLSPDEGIHLIWLRLLSAGYAPYTEVYITYPPLYPLAIDTIWRLWSTEEAQRWFSVGYTLFGAVGVALLGRTFVNATAGIVAATLLLFSPILFEDSRAVLGEFPSIAWSIWAIWFAWIYQTKAHQQRLWLILSAGCLALSLLTKLLSPFLLGLIPLIVAARWVSIQPQQAADTPALQGPAYSLEIGPYQLVIKNFRSLIIDMLLWGGTLLGLIFITVLLVDSFAFFVQVVGQRLQAREVYTAEEAFWPPRYQRGLAFIQQDVILAVLALLGMGIAWRYRQKNLWQMLVWLGLAFVMLAIHNPIRTKHFLILIPILAIFAGLTSAYWLSNLQLWLTNLRAKKTIANPSEFQARPLTATSFKTVTVVGVGLLIALLVWHIPATAQLWEAEAQVPQPPLDEVEALAFIQEVTAPSDCLISDDMPLLYWSGRMTPPELAEVSSNRLKSGALTTPELIAISDAYDCQLVAAVSNRIPKYLPDYMEWVKQNYLGLFHYGEDDLYFAKATTDPNPGTPLWADFAGQIIFHGYTLPQTTASPGAGLPLTLVWQAQRRLDTDYAIFVQVRNSANATIVSADHQPYQGLVPTSRWPKQAVIQETVWLEFPSDGAKDTYHIYVGVYDPQTGERLGVAGDTSGENALILGPLEIR